MKVYSNLIVILFSFLTACGQQGVNEADMAENQKEYNRHKQYFDVNIIAQFPKKIHSHLLKISSNLDLEYNNVGLLLFEFEVEDRLLDSIIKSVENTKISGKYKSNDTVLFYVIPNSSISELPNSRHLDKNVDYSNKLPIVDLSFYLGKDEHFESYLNNNFDIYVIEAQAGKLPKYAELQPNMNMPKEWRNGFSRGISISKKGKTVVYWTIIW